MSVDPAQIVDDFRKAFDGRIPHLVARAPGRINLIGEHTDYHDGFVLPAAINREVLVAASPRHDRALRVLATAYNERVTIALDALHPTGRNRWHDYIAGTAWALTNAGYELVGADVVIRSDVPIGAGLSSSAALEMAVARALCAIIEVSWDALPMAKLARKAENAFVGVGCGIMDQVASGAGVAGHALLLDCRSLAVDPIAIPAGLSIIVMDTGIRRSLGTTEYDTRRKACNGALDAARRRHPDVRTLRDVDPALLEAIRSELDVPAYRRVAHVVAENARPAQLAAAFAVGNYERAGDLVNASHTSLRDLYEVSSPELNFVTNLARRTSKCYGARMTGAGFGGSAIALVASEAAGAFAAEVSATYRAEGSAEGQFFTCHPADGASLLTV